MARDFTQIFQLLAQLMYSSIHENRNIFICHKMALNWDYTDNTDYTENTSIKLFIINYVQLIFMAGIRVLWRKNRHIHE